jgi:hypothetical protein
VPDMPPAELDDSDDEIGTGETMSFLVGDAGR